MRRVLMFTVLVGGAVMLVADVSAWGALLAYGLAVVVWADLEVGRFLAEEDEAARAALSAEVSRRIKDEVR